MAVNSTTACFFLGSDGALVYDQLSREGNVVGTTIVSYLFAIILTCLYAFVIVKSVLSIYGDLRGGSQKVHAESAQPSRRLTRKGTRGDEWHSTFKRYDSLGKGYVLKVDLAKMMQAEAATLGLRPSQAKKLVSEADVNQDGVIDFAEFARMMTEARNMRNNSLSLKASRIMLPRSQQADATVKILNNNGWFQPPIFLILIALMEMFDYFYQAHTCGWTRECVLDYLFMIHFERTLQFWRPFTFMLYHLSVQHLFGNIVGQFIFGTTLELVHRWRIVAIFLLGSLCSGLFATAVHSVELKQMGGASGGVYALVAAHFANVLLNWKEMKNAWLHVTLVSCYVIYDVVTNIALAIDGVHKNTSYAGHFGGFVGGILLGILLLRNAVQEKWERKVKIGALAAYGSFMLLCFLAILIRANDSYECSIAPAVEATSSLPI